MPAKVVKLGPGTVKIGETGTEVDFSCQVTAAHVDWTADADDAVTVLCGESVPGARRYSSVLAGSLLSDLGLVGGIVEYSAGRTKASSCRLCSSRPPKPARV